MFDIPLLTRKQKIGIYYKDFEWAKQVFDYLIADLSASDILSLKTLSKECYCRLKNGDVIMTITANEPTRGYRFTRAFFQPDIDHKFLMQCIKPCVRSNIIPINLLESEISGSDIKEDDTEVEED